MGLFLLFVASTTLLLIKVSEFISSPQTSSSSLLFGLSVVPIVLLAVLIWMLVKILVGKRIEVAEVQKVESE